MPDEEQVQGDAPDRITRMRRLVERVFVEAGRSPRRPDEGATIYVTADMIHEARDLLGIS